MPGWRSSARFCMQSAHLGLGRASTIRSVLTRCRDHRSMTVTTIIPCCLGHVIPSQIVAAWNGVAISAFALASRALSAESPPCPVSFPVDGCAPGEYLEAALKAARFARRRLYDEQRGTLWRSYRNGPSAVPGAHIHHMIRAMHPARLFAVFLIQLYVLFIPPTVGFADDYANMVAGCLDLFECGGGVEWLQWAVRLQATQDRLFRDPDRGEWGSLAARACV